MVDGGSGGAFGGSLECLWSRNCGTTAAKQVETNYKNRPLRCLIMRDLYIGNPRCLIKNGLSSLLIDILVKTAELSDVYFKHAAAIIDKNGFLKGLGYNHFSYKRHNSQYTIHAEVAVLRQTDLKYLEGGMLVVIRKNKKNTLAYSKPCPTCQKIIKKYMRKYGLRVLGYSFCASYSTSCSCENTACSGYMKKTEKDEQQTD